MIVQQKSEQCYSGGKYVCKECTNAFDVINQVLSGYSNSDRFVRCKISPDEHIIYLVFLVPDQLRSQLFASPKGVYFFLLFSSSQVCVRGRNSDPFYDKDLHKD